MTTQKFLSLDFDGVLHPSTEVQGYPSSGLPLSAWIQNKPGLLRWAPLIRDALEGSECAVLVHSTWRRHLRDSELRALLEPHGLAPRFVGSVARDLAREPALVQTMQALGLDPSGILILDDAPAEFFDLANRLLVCNPFLGVSDETILARIREWAR